MSVATFQPRPRFTSPRTFTEVMPSDGFSGRTFTLMHPLLEDGVDRSMLTGNFGDEYHAETLTIRLDGASPVYAEYYNNSGANVARPVYEVCRDLKPAR